MITNEPPVPANPLIENPTVLPESSSELTAPVVSPANPPWGLIKAFLMWGASVACLIFVPLVLVIPYLVYLFLKLGMQRPEEMVADKTLLFLSILGVVPAHILTFGIAWVIVTNWGRYPFFRTLGFGWPRSWGPLKGVAISAGLALVLLGFGALITTFLGGSKTQLDLMIESSTQTRIAIAFLSFFTAPFVEELVYRGVLYPALARSLGMGWAIALVSILFAGVHVYQYQNNLGVILVITVLSVALTTVRAGSGSLLPSFVIHLVFNGLQSLFLLLQPFIEKPAQPTPAKQSATLLFWAMRHLI